MVDLTIQKKSGLSNRGLYLAPNPATTEVEVWMEGSTISVSETLVGKQMLTVFDALGRMVWQRTLANAHWLSDTLFGALAGAAVTIVVWYLLYPPVTAERALPWRWGWRADGLRQRPGSASGDLTS